MDKSEELMNNLVEVMNKSEELMNNGVGSEEQPGDTDE